MQELGGTPKPVTPEGAGDGLLSADGARILARRRTKPGSLSLREIFVTDDLRSYAYTAYYQISSLFASDGKE